MFRSVIVFTTGPPGYDFFTGLARRTMGVIYMFVVEVNAPGVGPNAFQGVGGCLSKRILLRCAFFVQLTRDDKR